MFELDMHTHTVASGHAYSSLIENVRVAKQKGLKLLGVSDHAPTMPGGAHMFYFGNIRVLPDYIEGVRVLKGVEANIIDFSGTIDMEGMELNNLDYAIASLHVACITPSNKKDHTKALIGAMKNPMVKIIGHPDDQRYDKDYEEIVKAAKYYNKLLEVNNTSLSSKGFRKNSRDEIMRYLDICHREGVRIVCNSDAHFAYDIGNFDHCKEIIAQLDFPEELIVNHSTEDFMTFIKS